LLNFLRSAHEGNLGKASEYLQIPEDMPLEERKERARKLSFILDRGFTGNLDNVTARPEGSTSNELYPNRELAGHIVHDNQWTPLELVRINRDGRYIWLISQEVVGAVPQLFSSFGFPWIEDRLPRALVDGHIFHIPYWVFIAILAALPVALGLGWLLGVLVLRFVPKSWSEATKPSLPVVLLIGLALHSAFSQTLGMPLLYQVVYKRVLTLLFIANAVWLIFGLISYADNRARKYLTDNKLNSTQAMLQLGRRLLQIFVLLLAILIGLRSLGYDITAALAGLGIGGIAIALAAQRTLENLLGGFSLLSDQSIRVGDTCLFNGTPATVEEIGLRATKFRTLIRTALYIPNGQLANQNIENLGYRDKILFRHSFGVLYGTKAEDIERIRDQVWEMLKAHPKIDPDANRIRFNGFGDSSLNFEVFAYFLTSDWNEFLGIQEDVLLKIMNIVEANNTGFAFPTRTLHLETVPAAFRPPSSTTSGHAA
jgi:MscS family membrane protein